MYDYSVLMTSCVDISECNRSVENVSIGLLLAGDKLYNTNIIVSTECTILSYTLQYKMNETVYLWEYNYSHTILHLHVQSCGLLQQEVNMLHTIWSKPTFIL